MTDSYIRTTPHGQTSFVGPAAVNLFRVLTLKQSIAFTAKTGMLMTRGATMKFLLAEAGKITGQTYKGKKDADRAVTDLAAYLTAARADIDTVTA